MNIEKWMKASVKIWVALSAFFVIVLFVGSSTNGLASFLLSNFHWIFIHIFIILVFGIFFIKISFFQWAVPDEQGLNVEKSGVKDTVVAKTFFFLFLAGLIIEIADILWLIQSYYIR